MKIKARYFTDETKNVDISECSVVEFDNGEQILSIMVRNGIMEIRAADGVLQIAPNASNAIRILAYPF